MDRSNHPSNSGGDSTITTITTITTSSGASSSNISNSTTNTNTNSRDVYLKHLSKISHKISKPEIKPIRRSSSFDQNQPQNPPENPTAQVQAPQQQHQPPVYNINKNDFRDVVQRLTGSPAHERFSTPPPIQPPKPPSSRLQRIRPPPLAQISNRPPSLAQISNQVPNLLNCAGVGTNTAGFLGGQRQPLSPLPPFPAVHAAAESPISAYMRFLQSSVSSAASPRWNNLPPTQMPPHLPPPAALNQQQQNIPPAPQTSIAMPQFPLMPTSPLPFGCVPSPRSPYALLSPSLLFSPTGQLGLQQLPLSPSLPVPSPRWKGI